MAWAVVLGSFLQMFVQMPGTFRLLSGFRFNTARAVPGVRRVLGSFGPVVLGRGATQISAFIDSCISSLLPGGAVSSLAYAQTIYLLPVSLFGMSVSAAALPEMASASSDSQSLALIGKQLEMGLSRIAFFVIPSVIAFLGLGDLLSLVLFQSGQFTYDDSLYVWGILAGSTIGLLAATLSRLYVSVHYALHDTRTPLRYSLVRVTLSAIFGVVAALQLPGWLGVDWKWGVAGLTASSGVFGWVEFALLRRSALRRVPHSPLSLSLVFKLWAAGAIALIPAWAIKFGMPHLNALTAILAISSFGISYLLLAPLIGGAEVHPALPSRLRRGVVKP